MDFFTAPSREGQFPNSTDDFHETNYTYFYTLARELHLLMRGKVR
jgi:hypothetical protein